MPLLPTEYTQEAFCNIFTHKRLAMSEAPCASVMLPSNSGSNSPSTCQVVLYLNPFNTSSNQPLTLSAWFMALGTRPLHLPSMAQSKSTQPLQCFLRNMDARRERMALCVSLNAKTRGTEIQHYCKSDDVWTGFKIAEWRLLIIQKCYKAALPASSQSNLIVSIRNLRSQL